MLGVELVDDAKHHYLIERNTLQRTLQVPRALTNAQGVPRLADRLSIGHGADANFGFVGGCARPSERAFGRSCHDHLHQ